MSCAAWREALLLSEKRIMTLEMLPNSSLWSILGRNWDTGLYGMDGVGAGLSAVLWGAYLLVSPCYLKAKVIMLLNNEGGIALFHTNPRALVHLGLGSFKWCLCKEILKTLWASW